VSAGGTARHGVDRASGAAAPRDRLPHSGQASRAPEPGALRPLARALVDLAIALEREDEEDERWTR
jgi:hypothetical protein